MQSLDVFNPESCLKLIPATMAKRQMIACPRVGLTLKRYDEYKEKEYWMADYRYLNYPSYTAKMKDFIILSQICANKSTLEIEGMTKSKSGKINELKTWFNEGKTSLVQKGTTIKSLHKESMKSQDWAYVYGLH